MKHRFNDFSYNQFALDVLKGFSAKKKFLNSKYLYDDAGTEIFNEITRHSDYYLTRCELEIFHENKAFLSRLAGSEKLNLVDLGPGEGIKASIFLDQFIKDSLDFKYYAIDISKKYLNHLEDNYHKLHPDLSIQTLEADYFAGLAWLNMNSERRNLVLFSGSSIGNFNPLETRIFLKKMHQDLKKGDYVLIGFDLKKSTSTLMRAYNDRDGLTKAFNLNLLHRMNRELETDFMPEKFSHYARDNLKKGAMESFLVSNCEQTVYSESLKKSFKFKAKESIHVESSYKYLLPQIEQFAADAGFRIVRHFIDSRHYYVDSLWTI